MLTITRFGEYKKSSECLKFIRRAQDHYSILQTDSFQ